MKIAYGNYGMPDTPYETMLQQVADLGYDGIEFCVGSRYPTAPERLSATDRQHLRQLTEDHGLEIDKLMVMGITLLEPDEAQHAANLERLRGIFEFGHGLGLEQVIVVNTIGGRTEEWDARRTLMVDCIADWAKVAAEQGGILAIEPHVHAIVHSPQRALWVLEEIDNPKLKINFDYSHFEIIDIPVAEAVAQLIPHAVGTHVKDVRGRLPDFRFLLPGDGEVDYVDYLHQVAAAGYDGFITAEVSAQIFNAAGYDPLASAKSCYRSLSDAFSLAGIERS